MPRLRIVDRLPHDDDRVATAILKLRAQSQEPSVGGVESHRDPRPADCPRDHSQELDSVKFHLAEHLGERLEVAFFEWHFIRCAGFATVRQILPRELEQRIPAPRFAKDRNAARGEDSRQFSANRLQIQMMQNRTAPDHIERILSKRQLMRIRDDPANWAPIRHRAGNRFFDISTGKIERRNGRTGASGNGRGHAVAAAVVEKTLVLKFSEQLPRRTDPGLMIEIRRVVKPQLRSSDAVRFGALGCLRIMKVAFVL